MKCVNNFQLEIIVWKNQVSKTNFPAKKLGRNGRLGRDSEKQPSFCMQMSALHSNINCVRKTLQFS